MWFASDGRGDAGSALVGMAVWLTLRPQPQALRVVVQEDGACFTGQSYLGQPLGRFRARRGELALANVKLATEIEPETEVYKTELEVLEKLRAT